MGTFYFVSVKGEPVLMSYHSGSCSDIHALRLLVEQYAPPSSCFYSWRFKPPPGVGVQRFWDHLKAKGEPSKGLDMDGWVAELMAKDCTQHGVYRDCCICMQCYRTGWLEYFSGTPGRLGV